MTPICHRLRTLLGGELGNEAADRIEAMEAYAMEMHSGLSKLADDLRSLRAEAQPYTIETVAHWLETQGLTAVRTADAQRGEVAIDDGIERQQSGGGSLAKLMHRLRKCFMNWSKQ